MAICEKIKKGKISSHNPKVVGSNPASATIWGGHFRCPPHFCQYSCGFAGFLEPKIQSDFP